MEKTTNGATLTSAERATLQAEYNARKAERENAKAAEHMNAPHMNETERRAACKAAAEHLQKNAERRNMETKHTERERLTFSVNESESAAAAEYFQKYYSMPTHESENATKRESAAAAKNAVNVEKTRAALATYTSGENALHAMCVFTVDELRKAAAAERVALELETAAEAMPDTERGELRKAAAHAWNEKAEHEKAAAEHLYNVSQVLVFAKIKALQANENTWNRVNEYTRRSLLQLLDTSGKNRMLTICERLSACHKTKLNKNGDSVEYTDTKVEKALANELKAKANSDGENITQSGVCVALEYIQKAAARVGGENIPLYMLFTPFEKVVETSTTYTNGNKKPRALWKWKSTNVIKEMSLAIGKTIAELRAVRDSKFAALCYETLIDISNTENETEFVNVRHYVRSYDISIDTTNRKDRTETANAETERRAADLLQALHLTKQQLYIFKYCMLSKRFSFLECADKLQVSIDTVETQVRRIREKALASGFFGKAAERVAPTTTNAEKARRVSVYKQTRGGAEFVQTFDSLGNACAAFGVSKGNASKVLNGKRKSANGYIFEYATK